jgi:succinate dehydrogenase / fumarate reductase cytochrome b subunit
VALVLLGMHLRHGLFSAVQTLGQSNRRRERVLNVFATVFATVLIGGFLLIPAAVLLGVVE